MNPESPILAGLNPAQREAVDTIQGPLLVIAGAGSGKTRVITRRIARMMERGVAGETILAVTFTNKAAREMSHRVQGLVGSRGPTVSTFHAFGARFLREEGHRLGRPATFSLFDRGDSETAMKRVLERCNIDPAALPPGLAVEEVSRLKSRLESPERAMEAAISRRDEQLARAYAEYETFLRESSAFDFDDLIAKSVDLIEGDAELRAALADCFRYLLVDEYQDVNLAQWRLVRALGEGHGNVCVTGDPDQCIYAWRGADLSYILDFTQHFPGARVVRLEQNYRSRNVILKAASAVIRFNSRHGDKSLWSDRGEGEKIVVRRVIDDLEEARSAIARIRELLARGARRSEIAIFYRLNSLSLAVERALIYEGIPYQVWRGLEFFARKEVKDAVAWLRFLSNPDDRVSFARIANVPARGMGDKTLEILDAQAAAEGLSPGAYLLAGGGGAGGARARAAIEAFGSLLRSLHQEKDEPVDLLLRAVLERSGYMDLAARTADRTGQDPRGNLEQLIAYARDFRSLRPDEGLRGFLEEISLLSDADGASREDDEKVALMTVHTAKGLEFPHVIVVGMERDLFPHRMMDRQDEEEERRLFYVALTRARESILLLTTTRRARFGRIDLASPSIFLTEIPEELTQVEDEVGRASTFAGPTRSYEPEADPEIERIRRGARVRHPQFGLGTVQRIVGRGGAARVDVDFDGHGPKKLSMAFARLEPVEDFGAD